MEFLPSKKLNHADGLSRLLPKYKNPLEGTVIVFQQEKVEIKNTLCNTVQELLWFKWGEKC